jgi:Histidine kinase-, DNA gyrase B-, and HSP90-like ATPase
MTPEDLNIISTLFKDATPEGISQRLNKMDRLERKQLAELLFELKRRVYSTTLESSIRVTYQKIHSNMERMFFEQIFQINQNFKSNLKKWKSELQRLRMIDLFEETSDFDLLNVAENTEEIELHTGEPFLEQYEEVKGVYLLKDPANVFEFNSQVPVIARAGIFGDDACATGEYESSVTVKPITDCKALFISREKFVRLIRRVPGLQEKIFQIVVERAKQGSIRAEEQRKLTQEILDNIGQGSFSINVAGEIGENYTAIAAEYLGTENLAGVPFADLGFRNDREKLRNYYRALHLLFSGTEFNHNVVLDLLPNEVHVNNGDFNLHYSFVQDGAGHVMSVFVRMEDITLKRELERKEERERAVTGKMQSNVGGFMDMLDDVSNTFESVENFAKEFWVNNVQPESVTISEILRALHGSKGLSGQFELSKLKKIIHDFEDWFLAVDRSSIADHLDRFQDLFSSFEQEFEYAHSFKENLGEGIIKILSGVSFSQKHFAQLESAALEGDLDAIRSLVLSRNQASAQKIAGNWKSDAERLAQKLKKKIEVIVSIEKGLTVPKDMAKSLNINLGHLYRNCVDHGIETPDERLDAGKSMQGRISIDISGPEGYLQIIITDDGRGIDNQKISQIAIENQNLDQDQVKTLIENEDYGKIIFLPGFSTAKEVTETSGRGVGMDAVQTAVNGFQGDIDVNSNYGKGTEMIIRIPVIS